MTRKLKPLLSKVDSRAAAERYGAEPKSHAVHLVPADADEATWLDARRYRVGASELAAIVGVPGAYQSAFALWWAKHLGWRSEGTDETRMGQRLEPVIAEVVAENHPEMMICRPGAGLYAHPELDIMCATPDYIGVVPEYDQETDVKTGRILAVPVECKAYDGGPGWGKPGTDQVPEHIRVQVMAQCFVLGAPWGLVARMRGKRITYYTVRFDAEQDAQMASWVADARSFIAALEAGVPPEPDGHDSTTQALSQIYAGVVDDADDERAHAYLDHALALEYVTAHAARRAANDRYNTAANKVRQAMGVAKWAHAPDGPAIAERRVYKNHGYTVAPHTVDALHRKEEK